MCTGLEPLLLSAGASAGVASAGATALGALGAGALAKGMMKKPPSVAAPEKPPQASKAPERAVMERSNTAAASGAMAGNAGTFLTGPLGVGTDALNLGRNTLLGR